MVKQNTKRLYYLEVLWLFAFTSGLTFVLQDVEILRENPIQLSIIHKNISHLILGLFVSIQILKKPSAIFKNFILIFTLFSIWCAFSSLWSIYPIWTLYRSIEYFIFVCLVTYTAFSLKNYIELKKLVGFIWLLIGLLVISAWVGMLIFPEQAMRPSKGLIPFILHGALPRLNANSVSHIGGVISIIGLNRILGGDKKKKISLISLILFGVATMILAQGRSGMLAFIISAIFLLFFHRRISLLFTITSIILIFIVYTEIEFVFYEFILRGQKPEVIWDLSGRIYKWGIAAMFISEKPFLGYGAFAGSRFLVMPEITGTLSSSTHSAWVELAVDVGFVGALLYAIGILLIVINLLKFISKYKNNEAYYFLIEMLCILILLIVRSIFSTAVLITPYDFSFLAVLTATIWFRRTERICHIHPNMKET
ncbi:MAG: O-antigen ligase family protein [Candidatus Micrarchaeia archaeon]